MKTLPRLDKSRAVTQVLLDARADDLSLEVNLLLGRVRVDLTKDLHRLLELVLAEEVTRRLGEVTEHAELDEGRDGAEADLVTPAVGDVLEGKIKDVGDDLTTRNGDNVEGDETAAKSGGSELSDVKTA